MSSPAIDERQPLLPSSKPPSIAEAQEPLLEPENTSPKRPPATAWIWLIRLIVIAALVTGLAFLIKAIADSTDIDFDFKKAMQKALGGGLSGAAAMVFQVLLLMPLRTTMNYQYRYGTSTSTAIRTLYNAGKLPRFYSGLLAALIQGPLSRFGDTAANAGILALLQSNGVTKKLPIAVQSAFTSVGAALFRMILVPVDTVKTTLQTQGKPGMRILRDRVRVYGIGSLWYGAIATAAATFVGHYPWFGTYNLLDRYLPPPTALIEKLLRQAFIGFVASLISDTVSNSLRVVKTYRQVNPTRVGYLEAARDVVRIDGYRGLFGRGLITRILANGLQGILFSVLWKLFMDLWDSKTQT